MSEAELYRCHCGYLKQPEDGMHLSTVRCSLCCCPMRQTQVPQARTRAACLPESATMNSEVMLWTTLLIRLGI